MGPDDIEARPSDAALADDIVKAPVEVGRENIHGTVPPHETYEGRHRFDPTATWSIAEERKVVRKTDLMLLSWLCVMVRGHLSRHCTMTNKLSVLRPAIGSRQSEQHVGR